MTSGCPVTGAGSGENAPEAARAEAILAVSLTAVIVIDTAGIVHSFNPAAERLFGYRAEEMIGASVNWLMPSHHARQHDAYIQRYLDGGEPHIIGIGREEEAVDKAGRRIPIYLAVTEYWEGERRFFVGNLLDLSAVKKVEAELAESQRRYRQLFEASPAPKLLIDPASLAITAANPAAETFYGTGPGGLRGAALAALDAGEPASLRDRMAAAARGDLGPVPAWQYRGELGLREVELYCGPVPMAGGPQVAAIAFDVTEQRLNERRVRRLAYTDTATELANAAGFARDAEALLADGEIALAAVGLELLDHGNVRSALGPDAAETLARRIAARLHDRLGAEAYSLARVRRCEFHLLVPGGTGDATAEAALAAAQAPVDAGEQELRVGAIAGVVEAGEVGADAQSLTKRLAVALDAARSAGAGSLRRYAPAFDREIRDRLALATELRRALGEGGLDVYYQPQVRLRDGAVVGAEALARWPKPDGTFVSPADFIPVAEQAGFIPTLGAWVLEQACAQAATWLAAGLDIGKIAVNVSAIQLREDDLAGRVERVLARTGLPPESLELEITESACLEAGADSVLQQLIAQGVAIALDDFGTGYSALASLPSVPAKRLKIDKLFVHNARGGEDRQGTAMIDTILALARVMATEVLAEGIETDSDAAFLAARGCRLGQGFRYGRPEPAGVLAERLPALPAGPAAR